MQEKKRRVGHRQGQSLSSISGSSDSKRNVYEKQLRIDNASKNRYNHESVIKSTCVPGRLGRFCFFSSVAFETLVCLVAVVDNIRLLVKCCCCCT
jgi:hypothetical protein